MRLWHWPQIVLFGSRGHPSGRSAKDLNYRVFHNADVAIIYSQAIPCTAHILLHQRVINIHVDEAWKIGHQTSGLGLFRTSRSHATVPALYKLNLWLSS